MSDMTRRSFLETIGAGSILAAAGILAGCGSTSASQTASIAAGTSSQSAESSPSASSSSEGGTSAQAGSGKVLVACYSATGHTRAVAETLAKTLGADLFEIVPETPYTDDDLDFNSSSSRVSQEHRDESQRDVPLSQTTPDGFAEYGTVLVGYPIWWAIAAWPVNRFVSGNDFTGKTVIPFCMSQASGLGQSAENLHALDANGSWLAGQCFGERPDEANVVNWANSLAI